MDRMTTDNEKHGLFFLNTFYGKEGQVWVRGGGPAPGYEDCTLVDLLSRAATTLGLSLDEEDPETVGEIMYDNLQFGPMECDGVLGFLWLAAVQAVEMRGRLKMIENILGDNYDLDRLREIVDADREGRCVLLPCKDWLEIVFGDQEVFYGIDTDYLECPIREISVDSSSRCTWYDGWKTVVLKGYDENGFDWEFSPEDIGKRVFLTREAAEAALKGEHDGSKG